MSANSISPRPVVHLELDTSDHLRASALYARLLQWRPEVVRGASCSYLALDMGGSVGGGIVECSALRPLWLPYVEVERIEEATRRARELGAAVLLEPKEGPSGWRSVIASPEGGEIALWEPRA